MRPSTETWPRFSRSTVARSTLPGARAPAGAGGGKGMTFSETGTSSGAGAGSGTMVLGSSGCTSRIAVPHNASSAWVGFRHLGMAGCLIADGGLDQLPVRIALRQVARETPQIDRFFFRRLSLARMHLAASEAHL